IAGSTPAGVITGLVVVWAVEKNRCRRELATCRGRLRPRLSRPSNYPVDDVRSVTPTGADAVAEVLEEGAVDLWQHSLPGPGSFISMLTNLACIREQGEFACGWRAAGTQSSGPDSLHRRPGGACHVAAARGPQSAFWHSGLADGLHLARCPRG